MVTIGDRSGNLWIQYDDVIHSITWVLVVFAIIKQTGDNRWLLAFAVFATDLFRNLIILINPHEPNYKIMSISCTILVLVGTYLTAPKRWSY